MEEEWGKEWRRSGGRSEGGVGVELGVGEGVEEEWGKEWRRSGGWSGGGVEEEWGVELRSG